MSSAKQTEAENQVRLARSYAAKHLPWFAPALFRCRLVFTELLVVAGIDENYNVYWNPKSVALISNSTDDKKKGIEELAFIWIHEISHVLREHSTRRKNMDLDPLFWNYAADMEINDSHWPGTRHPTLFAPVFPWTHQFPNGKTAEWYYKKLGNSAFKVQIWDDGSGTHGIPRPWELQDNERQQISGIGQTIIRREVAREMKNHMPGRYPGGWGVWIKHTLEPKIDWRKVLKQRLSTSIAVGRGNRIDYSYQVTNRRSSIFHPIIRPTLVGTSRGQVAVVIDTSGSMTGSPIERAVAEIFGILKQLNQKVMLIPCDAQGYEPILLRNSEDLIRMLKLPGGGGTNMIKGIEEALKLTPLPESILVLTDGYTPFPNEKYKIPLLWGIIETHNIGGENIPPNPPWGQDTIVSIDISS